MIVLSEIRPRLISLVPQQACLFCLEGESLDFGVKLDVHQATGTCVCVCVQNISLQPPPSSGVGVYLPSMTGLLVFFTAFSEQPAPKDVISPAPTEVHLAVRIPVRVPSVCRCRRPSATRCGPNSNSLRRPIAYGEPRFIQTGKFISCWLTLLCTIFRGATLGSWR